MYSYSFNYTPDSGRKFQIDAVAATVVEAVAVTAAAAVAL